MNANTLKFIISIGFIAIASGYVFLSEDSVDKYNRERLELHENIDEQYIPLLQQFPDIRSKSKSLFNEVFGTVALVQYTGSWPKKETLYAKQFNEYDEQLRRNGFNVVRYDENPDLIIIIYESSKQTMTYEGNIPGYQKQIEVHWIMSGFSKPKLAGIVDGPALHATEVVRNASKIKSVYGNKPDPNKVIQLILEYFAITI